MNVDKNIIKEDVKENIELPENLDQLIMESVEKGYKLMKMKQNKEYKKTFMAKRVAIIMGVVLAGGAVSLPVKAFVTSLVQERMEQVPEKELDNIVKDLDKQANIKDIYSREYTDKEKDKMQSMSKAYNKGTFPEGEIRQEQTADKDMTDILYFAQDSSTFYLPERELTDEEILQIIDFNTKRDYGLEQRYEAGIGEEQKTKDKETEKSIKEAGGISKSEAIALGKEWIQKLYGVSGDGMELYCHLETDGTVTEVPVYNVIFNTKSVQNYLFSFDAMSGTIIKTDNCLVSEDIDAAPVSISLLEEKTDDLLQKAKDVLNNKLGKDAEYEKVVLAYSEDDGCLGYLNRVSFFFIKADGSAYEIGMSAVRDGFMDYSERSDYEKYTKEMEECLTKSGEAKSNFVEPKGVMVYKEM